jgi:hypothetical protein
MVTMEILLKIMRAAVFPFRFVYLVVYAWLTNRRRAAYLLRRADMPDDGEAEERAAGD